MNKLVLSLFPGIDIFGKGFEAEGFTVVQAQDKMMGGDICNFKGLECKFDVIIGGPPCQQFSVGSQRNGTKALNLIPEFERIVKECGPVAKFRPLWIMENVPQAPLPDLNDEFSHEVYDAWEYGAKQHRKRRFSANFPLDYLLAKYKLPVEKREPDPFPCVVATEYKYFGSPKDKARAGRKVGRQLTIEEMNVLMGLPKDFEIEGLLKNYQYIVRGNGVPLEMSTVIAKATKDYFQSLV